MLIRTIPGITNQHEAKTWKEGGIMRVRQHKGQSTLELCILMAVVVVAIIGLQQYVKYAAAGRLKSSADSISQTLFNPHNGDTELVVDRESTDVTSSTAADRLGIGAGLTVSTTAPGKDVSTRKDRILP